MKTSGLHVLLVAAGAASLVAVGGCLSDADLGDGTAACPPAKDFRAVSAVLERRCGMLDCHGDVSRPLRLYGQQGLRRPEPPGTKGINFKEYFTGGQQATTDAEVDDNYTAACGLEPELMDEAVRQQAKPDDLTLVRKPRLQEKHKGGRIWAAGSTLGDLCVVSWIQGKVEKEACRLELEKP